MDVCFEHKCFEYFAKLQRVPLADLYGPLFMAELVTWIIDSSALPRSEIRPNKANLFTSFYWIDLRIFSGEQVSKLGDLDSVS